MSGPSRNDPCPCGSGRKFKRCCGGSAPSRSGFTEADRESALNQLARFSQREEFEGDRAVAEKLFWGSWREELAEEDLARHLSSMMVIVNSHNFLTLDLEIEDGKTLVDMFLVRRGRSLLPGERRFLQELAGSHVGVYEIVEVRSGEGLRLRNLWPDEAQEEVWIPERSASRQLSLWDVLATRVLRRLSGEYVLEGDIYPFPARYKDTVLAQLEEDRRSAQADGSSISRRDILKRVSFRFNGLLLQSAMSDQPELGTFDGEPLEPATLRFAVTSPARLVRALDACEELQDEDGDRWVFLRELEGIHHLIGEFRIEESELVVQVMSGAHGRDARALLERIAEEVVRYIGTEERDVADLMQQGRQVRLEGEARGELAEPPSAESLAVVKQAMDQHYRRWLDDEIPALGGSTPRAAAADEELRPRLIELLKQMADQEQRHPSGPGAAYDFGWVRRELGLEEGTALPQPTYPQLVADLGHYLDNGGLTDRIPREARRIALYLGRIAASVSCELKEFAVSAGLDCRRRPGNTPCGGVLLVRRTEPDDLLVWTCPRCGDGGTIAGWQGTAFDLSTRSTIDGFEDSEGVSKETRLDDSDLRRLFRLLNLTGPALTLLVSARRMKNEVLLTGSPDEFAAVAGCIALELAGENGPASGVRRLVDLHGLFSWAAGRGSDLSYPAIAAELMVGEEARSPQLTRLPASGAPDGGHCLHVQLLDIEPPIWRSLKLPSRMSLADLHSVLVLVMGWANCHLHVFEHGSRKFAPPDPEEYFEAEDSRAVLLGELLPREGDRLVYEYDFGDSWRHEIRVESISASPPERPRLIDGGRACPPEDCGGPPGYERLLAALRDPSDPEHEELCTWAGDDFDPEVFRLSEHDHLLERLSRAWSPPKPRVPERT